MKWLLYLLSFSVLFISCGKKDKTGDRNKGNYSVQLIKTFSMKDSAEIYIRKLETKTNQPLFLKELTTTGLKGGESFTVRLGNFFSSYDAGLTAYRLLKSGVIDDYQILCDEKTIPDDFSKVIIVGGLRGRSSLYQYDIRTGKKVKVWDHPGEIITDLSFSSDMSCAMFITVTGFGRKSIFPFVDNVKIYRIDCSSMKVEKIGSLGSGIQIYTDNELGKAYRIVMNVFDKNKNTFVVENTFTYDFHGRLVNNEHKSFDLTKENYPLPPELFYDKSSPDNKSQFEVSSEKGLYRFSISRTAGTFRKNFLSGRQRLNEAAWSNGGEYLVFSTVDMSPKNLTLKSEFPETSCLYIVSPSDGRILKQWTGGGCKNFIFRGDLLLFDTEFGEKSHIVVYDVRGDKVIDTVTIAGGCGIRNIPHTPDFGIE